ncbi:E3 ubiquitin-protein ligase ATL41 [Smittium culicis]|uniref:E3 ubiquitin-protein ligase ATL41 n=1 Tax=Smittium culicis TaxID=133412 RepID=A0A1R1Y477_9FUNG|nr:E3 ubiquitin-protein ligase ATL41 [Smittium culicis]
MLFELEFAPLRERLNHESVETAPINRLTNFSLKDLEKYPIVSLKELDIKNHDNNSVLMHEKIKLHEETTESEKKYNAENGNKSQIKQSELTPEYIANQNLEVDRDPEFVSINILDKPEALKASRIINDKNENRLIGNFGAEDYTPIGEIKFEYERHGLIKELWHDASDTVDNQHAENENSISSDTQSTTQKLYSASPTEKKNLHILGDQSDLQNVDKKTINSTYINPAINSPRHPPPVLKKMEVSKIYDNISILSLTGTDNNYNCAICLDYIKMSDKVRSIPCKHIFHLKCLDLWLMERSTTCPSCRFNL